MDNPRISTPREAPPTWARGPRPVGSVDVKISPRQREFLLALIEEREVKPDQQGKLDKIVKCLRISEDPEEYGMGKNKAGELITWFLKQPKKKTAAEQGSPLAQVPAGRYAVDNNEGELRFYQVWESRDGAAKRLYVMFGPSEARLPMPAQQAIAQKILNDGIREAAIRFGMEIGSCSNCGRRLTNRISRELGIGPICGGRMFGDGGWKEEVKTKRQEIKARGEDPDEEVLDD